MYQGIPRSGSNKYNARRTEVDGIKFDSAREARRYLVLKQMEKMGEIHDLRRQVKYELVPGYINQRGEKVRAVNYFADFVYVRNGKEVIEDAKGVKTNVYNIKKKMFEYKYRKSITEV